MSATTDFVAAQKANRRNTLVLLVALTGVAALTGYVAGWALEGEVTDHVPLWSRAGLVLAALLAVVSLLWSLISLVIGDRLVLGMANAKPITKEDAPQLYGDGHASERVAAALSMLTRGVKEAR